LQIFQPKLNKTQQLDVLHKGNLSLFVIRIIEMIAAAFCVMCSIHIADVFVILREK